MNIEDIKPGFCYANTRKGRILVRKVLYFDIENNSIYYRALHGPMVKRGQVYNCASVRSFTNWCNKQVAELDSYNNHSYFEQQKSYIVLNTQGQPFVRCQQKKVNNYLKKGLLKWIDDDTLQYTTDLIEKKLLEVYDGQPDSAFLHEMHYSCVVCNSNNSLTKHHVVPRKDLKYYPLEIKNFLNNLLTVCKDCHVCYEQIKLGFSITDYSADGAIGWMNHFIETMEPKFLPEKWHILTDKLKKKAT